MLREEILEAWRELRGKFMFELSKCHHDNIGFYLPRPNYETKPEITCFDCKKDLQFFEEVD